MTWRRDQGPGCLEVRKRRRRLSDSASLRFCLSIPGPVGCGVGAHSVLAVKRDRCVCAVERGLGKPTARPAPPSVTRDLPTPASWTTSTRRFWAGPLTPVAHHLGGGPSAPGPSTSRCSQPLPDRLSSTKTQLAPEPYSIESPTQVPTPDNCSSIPSP